MQPTWEFVFVFCLIVGFLVIGICIAITLNTRARIRRNENAAMLFLTKARIVKDEDRIISNMTEDEMADYGHDALSWNQIATFAISVIYKKSKGQYGLMLFGLECNLKDLENVDIFALVDQLTLRQYGKKVNVVTVSTRPRKT